jgi:hypothetical protein
MTNHESVLRQWGALRTAVDVMPAQDATATAAFRAGADALELLRELEWGNPSGYVSEIQCCPQCWNTTSPHQRNCELARLIGAAREDETP